LDWIADGDLTWNFLDARSEACVGQKCAQFKECFVTKMRQKAFESDLVVVNHALFFSNLALETDEIGKVLPDFSVLILDEAHEVEDVAASHFGRRLSNYQYEEFERDATRVLFENQDFRSTLFRLKQASDRFFAAFPLIEGRHSLNFFREAGGQEQDLRRVLEPHYSALRERLLLCYSELQLVTERPSDWEALSRRLEGLASVLDEVFLADDPDKVLWFEKRGRGVFVHLTPIDIASLLQEHLFSRTDATVLTSATLTTDGNFEYFKGRLGLEDPVELKVPGEFFYEDQTMLYLPNLPAPNSSRYFEEAVGEIRELLALTEGRAFLLFTSFRQMNRVHEVLQGDLPFPLLKQGEMPKNRLLELFKSTPNSVLCATSSFWQGVDVRGDALRAVIIDKLPFHVPTEPLVAARIHRLTEQGENPFMSYTVPDAIITLKQGLGRLIRSREDWGILAVLDSRLRTKRYGNMFLRSLPNCPLTDNMDSLRNFFSQHASPANGGS
jgi:ATP-dependent DNA helicase DinG